MKILLIMQNFNIRATEKLYYQHSPGILYISAYLKKEGFDVDCFNLNHHPYTKLEKVLRDHDYDVVGMGGLYNYITAYKSIIRSARELRPGAKVILGGQIATAHPEFAMASCKPDFLIIGEGELATTSLMHALENNADPKDVKGIAYYEKEELIKTGPAKIMEDLDLLPYPDYQGFEFGHMIDNYPFTDQRSLHPHNPPRMAGIIAGRGCPAKCTFCFRVSGRKIRVRSVDNVISEIKYLMDNFNINDINMLDDLFAVKKERVFEFCEKVKPLNIGWQCQLRVNRLDESMLHAMKDAGCYQVSYGFESASPAVLKSMRKGIRVDQIANAIELTRKAKITLQANFIFGDPAETFETADETLRFAKKYRFNRLGKITPYPGTVLYNDLLSKGMLKNLDLFYETGRTDSGKPINMTSLTDNEYAFLLRKIYWSEIINRDYGKVTEIRKTGPEEHVISAICPICEKETTGNIVSTRDINKTVFMPKMYCTCRQCYQRFYLDDLTFSEESDYIKNITKIRRKIKLLRSRILYYSPKTMPLADCYRRLSGRAKQLIKGPHKV